MRIYMGLKVLPYRHLLKFEDEDSYGSESPSRPTAIHLAECFVWVRKDFQTHINPRPSPQIRTNVDCTFTHVGTLHSS